MKKKVFLFIYNGFADCEASYLLSCLAKHDRYLVKTLAVDRAIKKSLSGLSVIPDFDFLPQVDLKDIDETNTALLILPGGAGWEEKMNFEIAPLVKHCIVKGITVAASGTATLLLAELGLLNKIQHTSINEMFLKTFSSRYHGADYYVNSTTIYDKGVITADGLNAIDFSGTVLKALDPDFDEDEIVQSFYEGANV